MEKKISCANIGELANGLAAEIVDACIANAVRDLDDRADEDGKPRVVTITLTMTRQNKMTVVDVDAACKIPAYRAPSTAAKSRFLEGKHELRFQSMNAENADQPTFPQMDPESGELPT